MESDFIAAIEASYIKYLEVHSRSPEKLKPLHSYIARVLEYELGPDYVVSSMGHKDGKEVTFSGAYYDKNLDITVTKDGVAISSIALKFVMTNYKQNANNYFENMLGETANVRKAGLIYGQIIILRKEMPYYSSDKKLFTRIEKISDADISKYRNLAHESDISLPHVPDCMLMTLIDTGDNAYIHDYINRPLPTGSVLDFRKENLIPNVAVKHLSSESLSDMTPATREYLRMHESFVNFIREFVAKTKEGR